MMMTNQKEQSLLKDLKNEEKICAEKYTRYAQMAADCSRLPKPSRAICRP